MKTVSGIMNFLNILIFIDSNWFRFFAYNEYILAYYNYIFSIILIISIIYFYKKIIKKSKGIYSNLLSHVKKYEKPTLNIYEKDIIAFNNNYSRNYKNYNNHNIIINNDIRTQISDILGNKKNKKSPLFNYKITQINDSNITLVYKHIVNIGIDIRQKHAKELEVFYKLIIRTLIILFFCLVLSSCFLIFFL